MDWVDIVNLWWNVSNLVKAKKSKYSIEKLDDYLVKLIDKHYEKIDLGD